MSAKNKKFSSSNGFSLIELLIVVVITGIIAGIAIPNLVASKRSANEASAVSSLKTISNAESAYQFSFGAGQFGTLTQLHNSGLIDSKLGLAPFIKNRYLFELNVITASAGQTAGFNARARPQHHTNINPIGGAGTRDFGTNESGIIYQTSNATVVNFDLITRNPTGSAIPFSQH